MLYVLLRKNATVITLLLMTLIGTVMGQDTVLQPVIRFNQIPLNGETPYRSIFDIKQDQQGFMWFGTRGGLYRYDGYRVTAFTHDHETHPALPKTMSIVC